MEDLLIKFQCYLNDRGLITNHDWDFEKEAKRFIRKNDKSKGVELKPFMRGLNDWAKQLK